MNEYLVLGACLMLLFVVGCQIPEVTCNTPYIKVGTNCCLDKDYNKICDIDETTSTTREVTPTPQITDSNIATEGKTSASSSQDYGLQELQQDINNALGKNLTWRNDKSETDYYNTGPNKYYVIKIINEDLTEPNDFYKQFSAPNWNDHFYFINETNLKWLNPSLSQDNFSDEDDYKDYLKNRKTIEQTTVENTFEVENGKVLEYQFINWIYDIDGYFVGSWEPTLLIYKIYCSPSYIVYLRPEWDKLKVGLTGAKSEGTHSNWESMVERIRQDLLLKSNKILGYCPVEKDFFNNMPTKEFKVSKPLYNYYKANYEFYWDLTTTIAVDIQNNTPDYLLTGINLTFKNNEDYNVGRGGVFLDVKTSADGKAFEDFVSSRKVTTVFASGMTFPLELKKSEEIKFNNNLTIQVMPYLDNGRIPFRPSNYVIFTDGTIVRIK